ncbi:MAG: MmgE/PrpD family protein [Rhodospirillales bacterium]
MILARFADYAAGLATVGLSDSVAHAAKRAVVDWFAAMLPGGLQPPATLLIEALADTIGRGGAVLYPSGRLTDARTAALINGAAAHTIEFDDIFRDALYHPGAPVISAALAAAQVRKRDGKALLAAIVAGYEVSNRIGLAVNPAHYEFWHTTGTVGTFGAAVGASAALGLDGARITHAMANAGTMAAGLQQTFLSDAMAKPMHAAHAAEVGVMLALAAERGVTGAVDILEGPRGFGAAMSKDPDWQAAVDDLGKSFTIERMTFKNHAACGHAHAAVDGVLALRNKHGLKPEQIVRIRCGTFAKAVEIVGNPNPKTVFEAKFSLPYCAAVALTTGSVRTDAFRKERLKDAKLRALIAKVEVVLDAKIDAEFPKRRAAMIEIETTAGERFEHYASTRKGDPDNPLSDGELEEKFLELVEPILGKAPAKALLKTLWRLETVTDVRAIPAAIPEARLQARAGAAQ